MRYRLKFRDGSTIDGEMVGEMGGSIILRPDLSDSVRVIHLSELSGAWEIKGSITTGKQRPAMVTFNDEFRVIEPDEVDDLITEQEPSRERSYPEPDFYYEISFRTDSMIISCDTTKEVVNEVEVDSNGEDISVTFLESGLKREIIVKVTKNFIPPARIISNRGILEIIVPIGS